jgi:hypothetical protein
MLTRAVAPPAILDCEGISVHKREEIRIPVWRNAHETILVCFLVIVLSVCVSPLRSISQPLDEDVLEVTIKKSP